MPRAATSVATSTLISPAFKTGQCTGSGALAFVAVYRGGLNINLVEFFGEPVRAVFGGREHQHLLPIILFYQVAKQFGFVGFIAPDKRFAQPVPRRCCAGRLRFLSD